MTRVMLMFISLALSAAGCAGEAGGSGDAVGALPTEGVRTIEITMVDIAYEPGTIEVSAGETVRLRFTNEGDLPHDAFVGDAAAQDGHEVEMRAGDAHDMSEMDGATEEMDDEPAITLQPGETGEIVYTFGDEAILIGCHETGHYEAGMVTEIVPA